MTIDELVQQSGEWLKGTGPDSDVVISSRIRLARNLSRFHFMTVANAEERAEIQNFIRRRIEEGLGPKRLQYFALSKLPQIDRQLLFERHLVSREHATGEGERGVAVSSDETVSIMVNEEDHLRLQVLRSGLQLEQSYEQIDRIDTDLEQHLTYAYHPRFGYLTCCPTNVGTGLRISVMLHLPAAVLTKQIEKVLGTLGRLNYTVRGLYGEGTSPIGDLYQISNQVTLGKSEHDLISEMKNVIPKVLEFERVWRHKLADDEPRKVEDRVWRAYGLLKHARVISSEETIEQLSYLRLGVYLGIIPQVPMTTLNDLFIFTQPSHLQKVQGKALESADRDVVRAEFIRKRLAAL